ncbi:MAG: DHH family phosphoesterase [Candidatus Cloacimonadaceae bacterium]|nr:DHH family phosphoesterase [Candidatus Cloacimonadaceae bacterium]
MINIADLRDAILSQLKPELKIAIMSHVNPDGDGFCASLALQRLIARLGFESMIVIDEGNLDRFSFLMKDCSIEKYRQSMVFDLLFVLDCNSRNRLGERYSLVKAANTTVLIDHHEQEDGTIPVEITFIDQSYVSVGAILFDLFESDIRGLEDEDRIHIGNCLYATILNDTNNFTNANVNPSVFRIAGEINSLGIAPHALYKDYFLNQSAYEMRYVGEVLSTIELHHKDRILYMHSSIKMLEHNDLDSEAVMNITRWVQGVKGLDVIVYFREEETDHYKLSLRSLKLDVNKIAVSFGGGGHKNAAGCQVKGSLDEVKTLIKKILVSALNEYYANNCG